MVDSLVYAHVFEGAVGSFVAQGAFELRLLSADSTCVGFVHLGRQTQTDHVHFLFRHLRLKLRSKLLMQQRHTFHRLILALDLNISA